MFTFPVRNVSVFKVIIVPYSFSAMHRWLASIPGDMLLFHYFAPVSWSFASLIYSINYVSLLIIIIM